LLAPVAAGCRLLTGGPLHLLEFLARPLRCLGGLLAHGLGAAAYLAPRLFDQPFELPQQRVGLPASLLDQVGEHFLGVAARHPPAFARVVDDLLQAIAAKGDTALEALAELLDALVEAGGRPSGGFSRFGFFRRWFFGRGFLGGRFFGTRAGFGFFRGFAGGLVFRGHSVSPPDRFGRTSRLTISFLLGRG